MKWDHFRSNFALLDDSLNMYFNFFVKFNTFKLKAVKSGEEAAILIKKHKFTYDHIPSAVKKYKEIWPALIEQMNLIE